MSLGRTTTNDPHLRRKGIRTLNLWCQRHLSIQISIQNSQIPIQSSYAIRYCNAESCGGECHPDIAPPPYERRLSPPYERRLSPPYERRLSPPYERRLSPPYLQLFFC
jgi:hypothetical protein